MFSCDKKASHCLKRYLSGDSKESTQKHLSAKVASSSFYNLSTMNSRLQEKVYRYAVFYFPETNKLGTVHTAIIAEGYRCSVTVGSLVKVHWEDESRLVPAKIIQMDGDFILGAPDFTVHYSVISKQLYLGI
ncbi:uncharacterized protein [Montipora foliosa]|uniref:uncharacterized protein n=1 Tax=Montipora foliosa TaxID=591990 RepID=UPI0035F12C96